MELTNEEAKKKLQEICEKFMLLDESAEAINMGYMALSRPQIPYNATNGEVMELIFGISLEEFKKTWGGGSITEEWWNAPYQKEVK